MWKWTSIADAEAGAMTRLAANLRAIRLRMGLTQERAAARAGIGVRAYQALESGQGNPTVVTLEKLASALEIDVALLFFEGASMPSTRPGPGRPARLIISDASKERSTLLLIAGWQPTHGFLSAFLRARGYEVKLASTGAHGLELTASQRFDLVVIDDEVPDMSFEALVAALAPLESRTIALCGLVGDASKAPSWVPTLTKPFDLDAFIGFVGRVKDARDLPQGARTAPVELVMYVTAGSLACVRALRNLKRVVSRCPPGAVDLRVVDLAHSPADPQDRVFFTPTLVKRGPGARALLVGDLSDERALFSILERAGVRDPSRGPT